MNLLEQMERDAQFGLEIMQAAGIRTLGPADGGGVYVNVLKWFSKGKPVGPVFAYFPEREGSINLMWPYQIKEPRLYQCSLKKALPIIGKTDHCGIVAIRLFISSTDGKAYGFRWKTSLDNDIALAMRPLIKMPHVDWMKWITDGCEGEWLNQEFNYTYSGSLIRGLNLTNAHLIALRAIGYELPVHLDNPLEVKV